MFEQIRVEVFVCAGRFSFLNGNSWDCDVGEARSDLAAASYRRKQKKKNGTRKLKKGGGLPSVCLCVCVYG